MNGRALKMNKKEMHGGNIWSAARRLGVTAGKLLDFSSNLNDFPVSYPEGILGNLDLLRAYPDPDHRIYLENLAKYLSVSSENILLGPGLTHMIYKFCQANRSQGALIIDPSFSEYEAGCSASSIPVYHAGSIQEILEASSSRNYNIVVLASPSNPVGNIITWPDMQEILSAAERSNFMVFLDEAFADFASDYDRTRACREATENPNLVVGRSLTKLFGLASLRLGLVACNRENIDRISGVMEPWSVGQDALEFVMAMNYGQFSRLPEITARERLWMTSALSNLGFHTAGDPRANYFVVRIPDAVDVQELESFLNARNILVKMINDAEGTGKFCRIAVKRHEYNVILVESFRSFIKSIGEQDD